MQNKDNIKFGDILIINPLYGKKRQLKLLRTEYFLLINNRNTSSKSHELFFEGLKGDDYKIRIYEDESGFYRVKSEKSFNLNGQSCFEAYLKKNDRLLISGLILELKTTELEFENKKLINSKIINSTMNILLIGETGTGKTYEAKKIHKESKRSGNFVHLNLSSIPKTLLESELFGYKKGAFTGALLDKEGAIYEARSGTLFLDEIDSLSLELQVKLLIFLESKTYRSIGARFEKKSDTRIIFASSKSLEYLLSNNLFREDFYYRLKSSFEVILSPLRRNLVSLKSHLSLIEKEKKVLISRNLLKFYLSYSWPGNIRQLRSHLEKKIYTSNSQVLVFDKLDELLISNVKIDSKIENELELNKVVYLHGHRVFNRCGGDIKKTCDVLSVSRFKLQRILNF